MLKGMLAISLILLLSSCTLWKKKEYVETGESNQRRDLTFERHAPVTARAIREVLKEEKWEIEYDRGIKPKRDKKGDDVAAWRRAESSSGTPFSYIKARSGITMVSYGTDLFFVTFATGEEKSHVVIVSSTDQAFEKKKMKKYVATIKEKLNKKLYKDPVKTEAAL